MTESQTVYIGANKNLYDQDFVAWAEQQALLLYQVGWNEHSIIEGVISQLCLAACPNGLQ